MRGLSRRRPALALCASALALPAAHALRPSAARRLRQEQRSRSSPAAVRAHVRPGRRAASATRSSADGGPSLARPARGAPGTDVIARSVRELADGALHGALARALGRLARGLRRLHLRRAACGARRRWTPTARPDRREPSTSCAGATSSLCADDRLARLPAALLRGLPLPPRSSSASPRRRSASSACSSSAFLAFVSAAEDALQLPFGRLLYGDLSPITDRTRFGKAFVAMTLGFALVAALIFLAWLLERSVLLWPAFVTALGRSPRAVALGARRRRRRARRGSRSSPTGCTSRRLALGRRAGDDRRGVWPVAPGLRREAFLRFSRLAVALVGLMLAAGIYLSIAPPARALRPLDGDYGRVLLVKLALVAVVLAWGAVHHFVVRPRARRARPEVIASRRSVLGESAVAMAVLLAAAVLVDSSPPPQPEPGPPETASV